MGGDLEWLFFHFFCLMKENPFAHALFFLPKITLRLTMRT